MKKYYFSQLNEVALKTLCRRKTISFDNVLPVVKNVIHEVKTGGDMAVRALATKFDGVQSPSFLIDQEEIRTAGERVPKAVQNAFKQAARNIKKFHSRQKEKRQEVKTMDGITCFAETRPIEKVGLYIPGGTAPLPSTVLMLAIPAQLAGCKDIVLVTPPAQNGGIDDTIAFAAALCGVTKIFKIGGAQAVAALAFGTETIPQVYKIFGPGNAYVTAAKMLVSIDPDGAAVDMPSGPTEVLVVADENARVDFVASDLLAQAEHGIDSQSVLVTTSNSRAEAIHREVTQQLRTLPRKEIAKKALGNSFTVVVDTLKQAVEFSNRYAPEHLILNVKQPNRYVSKITNAGSVFLGPYACESVGDYASGTNHSLPTYGYAKTFGGVSVSSFQKRVTFQKITRQGAKNIGPIVSIMASQETLEGHKRAMQLRYI